MGNDLALKVILQAQDQASGTLKGFGSTLASFAGDAGPMLTGLLGISALTIGVGVAATKMAADYQQSMNMVQALTGASNQQMNQYDAQLKSLAIETGVAPKKLADGLYYTISAGYSGADAMHMLSLSTKDSVIGMTSASVTANALTTIMKSFSKSISDADAVNGEMLRTVTLGKMTMQDYASTVGKTARVSMQYKTSMEDMNASLATLTANGFPSAAQAGTAYSALLAAMDGKTDLMAKRIHKLGLNFDEAHFRTLSYSDKLAYLNTVMRGHSDQLQSVLGGSKQAAGAFQVLTQHSGDFATNLRKLSNQQDNANATQKAWAVTQSGFNVSLQRLQQALNVALITIGQGLLPILTQVVQALIPMISSLLSAGMAMVNFFQHNQTASDALKAALVGFAVVVGAILIPAFIAWAIAAGSAALATLAATWPIIAIGAAVALVVFGIIEAVQHWGAITAWLSGVWGSFSSGFMGMMKNLGDFFVGAWTNLQKVFQAVWAVIINIGKAALLTLLAVILGPLGLLIVLFMGPFHNLLPQIEAWFNGLVNKFRSLFGGLASEAISWGTNLITGFLNGIKGMMGNVGNVIGNVGATIRGWLGFHSPTKNIPDAMEWGPNFMKMFAEGMQQNVPLVESVMKKLEASLRSHTRHHRASHHVSHAHKHTGGYSFLVGSGGSSGSAASSGGGGSSSGITINNFITINAAKAGAREVYDEFMKRVGKDLRRGGNLVTITSGGKA